MLTLIILFKIEKENAMADRNVTKAELPHLTIKLCVFCCLDSFWSNNIDYQNLIRTKVISLKAVKALKGNGKRAFLNSLLLTPLMFNINEPQFLPHFVNFNDNNFCNNFYYFSLYFLDLQKGRKLYFWSLLRKINQPHCQVEIRITIWLI